MHQEATIKINGYKKIKILESLEETGWDNFVSSHPDGKIYHTSNWIKALENESGTKNVNLVCLDEEDKIEGIFPLLYTRGFPFGAGGLPGSKRLSSLPRTPLAGPLAYEDEIYNALIDKAVELVKEDKDIKLQIKSLGESLTYSGEKFTSVAWRETYIYEIPPSGEEIRFGNSRNHSAIKRAVNKAERSGLTIRTVTSPKELRQWYLMYLETMAFHMTPARSFSFFKDLWEKLAPQNLMRVDLAVLNDKEILSGSIFFSFNDTVIYGFNGSKRDLFDFRPNDLLHWNAIHTAQKEGFKYYDMGEVQAEQEGLAAYKSKWCNLKRMIYHYYYPLEPENIEASIDTAPSGKMKKTIWKKIPLPLTEVMGRFIYRYL
jgi:hypothetical protein